MVGLFIAGANTGVGKTYVATLIARALVKSGRRVGVYKPVASGCRRDGELLVAEDAELLWRAAGEPGELERVCPQKFAAPLAPPLAAQAEGRKVDRELLRTGLDYWRERSEIVLVEGAGGLMSPLSESDYNITLAADLGLPMAIVTANELGAINASLVTLITAQAVAPQLPIAGIVLSQTQEGTDQSIATNAMELAAHCEVPVLAAVEFQSEHLPTEIDWFALASDL